MGLVGFVEAARFWGGQVFVPATIQTDALPDKAVSRIEYFLGVN
jgi:hypothetical protein